MGTKGVWGASGATGCRTNWKEVAPMKRITFLLTVALVVALMMAVAGPALATIHPLSNAECADASASDVANLQEPPGISGDSQGKPPNNFIGGNFAQPVLAASGGDPFSDPLLEPPPSPAFKTVGPDPAALDVFSCPANK